MVGANWWADRLYYEGGSETEITKHPNELYPPEVLEAFRQENVIFRDDRILIPSTENVEKEVVVDDHLVRNDTDETGPTVCTPPVRRGPLATFHDEYDDPRPIVNKISKEECGLHRAYEERMSADKDLKLLITARNGQLGVGKSTLAITLAKFFDDTWTASERATFDADEYIRLYQNEPPGSVLVFDDIEQALNRRRAMSEQNVEISKMLEGMRFRQMMTIFVAPSVRTIDTWLQNLIDIRINVIERGIARVYEQRFDDFDPSDTWQERLHRIQWPPLDDDPEYRELQRKKEEYMTEVTASQPKNFDKDDLEDAKDEAHQKGRKEKRDELIRQMDEEGYSQQEIADIVELSQPTVSEILN